MPVRAITFDFWRTLFREADNQPERQRIRLEAFTAATGVPAEAASAAFAAVYAEFERSHRFDQRTLQPQDGVRIMARHLGITIAPDTEEHLARVFGTAILCHPPKPIEGALEAVTAAAACFPVGLISDVGMSPSASISELLERNGFLEHFSALVFSDLVGVSKPQAPMFERAASCLAVEPNELLHVGDLEYSDVAGALGVGAAAVLFAGDNTAYLGQTRAHHTFTAWRQFTDALPTIAPN